MRLLDGVRADASLSTDGRYRYVLTRTWFPANHDCLWIMLNPSTADAHEDDWTIRRCQDFARRWGHGGIVVANLFALRSRDPRVLASDPDPIGPANDDILVALAGSLAVKRIVCAWGNGGVLHGRGERVHRMLLTLAEETGILPQRLGPLTNLHQPHHPRGLAVDQEPVVWM